MAIQLQAGITTDQARNAHGAILHDDNPLFQEEVNVLGLGTDQNFKVIRDINGKEVNLRDTYRQATNEGSFIGLSPEQRALAQAYKNLGMQWDGPTGTSLDPTTVPGSGDLKQLSQQLGVSWEALIEARRKNQGGISSSEGAAGKLETESFAERSALPATGTGTQANSYWDESRGVQVYAPVGKHFELYPNGAVKTVDGPATSDNAPASSLFTQGTQQDPNAPEGTTMATPGFKKETLGYQPIAGKTITSTGQSMYNPLTKVNEYAGPGEVLIQYSDGTVERRKVGGAPGEAVDASKFGRTPEELGLNPDGSQKLTKTTSTGGEQGGNGIEMSSNLEFIGKEYTAANGQRRVAPEGQAFFQDIKTRTILLRPEDQAQYAQESTSPSIIAERQKQADSGQLGAPSIESMLSDFGFDFDLESLKSSFQSKPIQSFQDLYSSILQSQGVPQIKAEIDRILKEQKDLDAKFADDRAEIDSNPWLSESLRSRKQTALADKYELKKSQLTAQQQLFQSMQEDAREEARFVATTALAQYNADRQFEFQQLEFAVERAEAKLDAQIKLQQLSATRAESAAERAYEARQEARQESQYQQTFAENQRQFNANYALSSAKEARIGTGRSGGSSGGGSRGTGTSVGLKSTADTPGEIKAWIIANRRANPNADYYDLWGKLADNLQSNGLNASNYDKQFWEVLHPEGLAGYTKYVKKSGSGVSFEDI